MDNVFTLMDELEEEGLKFDLRVVEYIFNQTTINAVIKL